jgi:hypothetical protein
MMKMKLIDTSRVGQIISSLIILLLFASPLKAQTNLDVTIILPPPYPINLDAWADYMELNAIQVNNNTSNQIDARFSISMREVNGTVQITTSLDAAPPVTLEPGINFLTPGDVRDLFENIGSENIVTAGLSNTQKNQIEITKQLPEGEYQLCIRAFNEQGVPISEGAPSGCQDISLVYAERPVIDLPFADETVLPSGTLTIIWSQLLTDPQAVQRTEYSIKILDMTEQNITNAMDAMLNPGVSPEYEATGVTNPLGLLDEIDFPMVDGHRYAIRVTAYDPLGFIGYQFGGHSEIVEFNYGEPQEEEQEEEQETTDCGGECAIAAPTDVASASISGNKIKIGRFELEIANKTGNATAGYTGTGKVKVAFLNNAYISVDFEGIKVNSAQQVIEGEANGVQDGVIPPSQEIAQFALGHVPDIGVEDAKEIMDAAHNTSKLISLAAGNQELTLPIGWNRQIEGEEAVIGMTHMKFNSTGAELQAMFSIEHPEWGEYIPSFGASGICFSPGGFETSMVLYLLRDYPIPYSQSTFTLKGLNETGGAASDTGSYVIMDCNGFKKGKLSAEVKFPRDWMIPDAENGEIGEGQVTALFAGTFTKAKDFMFEASITPFQVPGLEGWSWEVTNATIDFSETDNAPNMELPKGYTIPGNGTAAASLWKGFYLQSLTVRSPSDWMGDGTRKSIGVRDVIIDKTGVSGFAEVTQIIKIDEGAVEGWAFSLDTFRIQILQNSFLEARMAGEMGMPIFEDGSAMGYSAIMDKSDPDLKFIFNVKPNGDDFTVPMFVARLGLQESSYVNMVLSKAEKSISARLNGSLGINESYLPESVQSVASNLSIDVPELRFEGLEMGTKSGFKRPTFSFASPQKSISGFPLTLEEVSVEFKGPGNQEGTQADLIIVPKISLVGNDNGISADGKVRFTSSIKKSNKGKYYFELQEVNLERLHIDISMKSGMSMEGYLEFISEDGADEVRGGLEINLPPGISAKMNAVFGAYKSQSATNPTYNTSDYYSYWYLDALVSFKPGIPILNTGTALFGLGGGAYYHMRKGGGNIPSGSASLDGPAESTGAPAASGVNYVRDFNTLFGLKATIVMGTANPQAFNCDATLEAAFSNSGGIQYISLDINGYIMSELNDRTAAKVRANGNLTLSHSSGQWDLNGNASVYVDFAAGPFKMYGDMGANKMVDASLHIGGDSWHFYIGTPKTRGALKFEIPLFGSRRISGYMMTGEGLDSNLPDLPPLISQLLGRVNKGMSGVTKVKSGPMERQGGINYAEAAGFAFGVQMDFNIDATFVIIYADVDVTVGFDINITKDDSRTCGDITNPGMDGWYAQGQVYAGIRGEIGLYIDVFIFTGKIKLIEAGAAILLRGGAPNPVWVEGKVAMYYEVLGGLIEGTASFDVAFGEKCQAVSNNPFGNLTFIGDAIPNGTGVSVFTDPKVSFNNKLKTYNIPKDQTNPTGPKYVLTPYIYKFELREGSASGKIIPSSYKVENSQLVVQMETNQWLASYTRHYVFIELRGKDQYGRPVKMRDGNTWIENKTFSFTTGGRPKTIPDEMVNMTLPFQAQRYYLQSNNWKKKGLIKLKKAMPGMLASEKGGGLFSNIKYYNYFMRFSPVRGGANLKTEMVSKSGKVYDFKMPPSLNNRTIYRADLVQMKIGEKNSVFNQAIADLEAGFNQFIGTLANFFETNTVIQSQSNNLGDVRKVKQYNVRFKDNPNNLGEEKVLYSFTFASSKYNSLWSKLSLGGTGTLTQTGSPYYKTEVTEYKFNRNESLDAYDVSGYYKHGARQYQPLLKIWDKYEQSYHTNKNKGQLYDPVFSMMNRYALWVGSYVGNSSIFNFGSRLDEFKRYSRAYDAMLRVNNLPYRASRKRVNIDSPWPIPDVGFDRMVWTYDNAQAANNMSYKGYYDVVLDDYEMSTGNLYGDSQRPVRYNNSIPKWTQQNFVHLRNAAYEMRYSGFYNSLSASDKQKLRNIVAWSSSNFAQRSHPETYKTMIHYKYPYRTGDGTGDQWYEYAPKFTY